ncbi:MAG: hypothetical protein AAB539_04440 [Patescibacteria group bacterium]
MNTVTVPKRVTRHEELVVLSRREYEKLRAAVVIPEFEPTAAEKKDLVRARKNRKAGKFLTFHELKQKLGFTD